MKENDILFAFGIGAAVFMAIFIGANDIANGMRRFDQYLFLCL